MRHSVSSFSRSSMLPSFPMIRGTFVGETSTSWPPSIRRASRSCIVSWTFFASSTLRTWARIASPTFRNRVVSPNSTCHGLSVAWRGAGDGEPMGWPDVDDLADDGVAGLGDVTAGQRDDADPPVLLGEDAEMGRVDLAAFAESSGTGFHSRAAHGLARDDNLANRAFAFHWVLSLTRTRRNGPGYLSFWVARPSPGSETLVLLQDARLHVPLRLRVELLEELRLHPCGHLHDPNPRPRRLPLLPEDCPERLEVAVALRAVLRAQLHGDADFLESDRDEGAQGAEDVLHLLLDPLARVHMDLRLLHRDLDPLGRVGRACLGVDRVRRDVLDDLPALRLEHLAALLRRELDLALQDDLLRDGEGFRRAEELGHLLLGGFRAFVGVPEHLVDRELAEEIDLLPVAKGLDRIRLYDDLEPLAGLLDPRDHILGEDVIPSVGAKLLRHGLPLGGRGDPGAVIGDLGLPQAAELFALDDDPDLDGPGVELLPLGRLLEGLEAQDDGIVLCDPVLVLLLEELHDRVPARADAARLVRHKGPARAGT